MRDFERISEFVDVFQQVWEEHPDWRFFQLVTNIQRYVSGGVLGADCFYMEDDEALAAIKEMFGIKEESE